MFTFPTGTSTNLAKPHFIFFACLLLLDAIRNKEDMKELSVKNKKKPNCKEGNIACGKKCQPKHYKCPSEKSTEVSKASDKFVDNILAITTDTDTNTNTNTNTVVTADAASSASSASTLVSSPPKKTLASPSEEYRGRLAKLIDIFNGDDENEENSDIAEPLNLKEIGLKKISQGRLETVVEKSKGILNEKEALAISRWTSFVEESFEPINKVLFSSEEELLKLNTQEIEYGTNTGIVLAGALKKLRNSQFSYSTKNIEKNSFYQNTKIRADRKLSRSVRINESLIEKFLKPYKESLENDGEYVERNFAATTIFVDRYNDVNVEIVYEPLQEGSSAIMLEYFKTRNEGEIIYPPGAKFKIQAVREKTVEDMLPNFTDPEVKRFLKNFGLSQPESLEELYTLMALFEANRPNYTDELVRAKMQLEKIKRWENKKSYIVILKEII